jgi:hypothetical protein
MANRRAPQSGIVAFLELAKTQRIAWSCALVVGLFLTWYGHVPVFPVLLGCVLAVSISTMRAWPRLKAKPAIRGGR